MAEIKFKPLTVESAFDFCLVLDAIGTDEILAAFDAKEISALSASGKDSRGIGTAIAMKIPGIIIKNLPKAKNEIYAFFAGCMVWDDGTAVTVADVRGFRLARFVRLLKEFFSGEDMTDFFAAVAELLGTERKNSVNASSGGTATHRNISIQP